MKRAIFPLLVAGCLCGCGHLREPRLPEGAASAPAPAAPIDQAWENRLRAADAIYFSLTKTSTDGLHSAAQIVEWMQRSGERVALGWAEIPAIAQPLFEQWSRQEISAGQLLEQLAQPERGAWLRQTLRPDLGQVALGGSRELLGKIRDGTALSAEEKNSLPQGYRTRPGALENFVERATGSARLRRLNLRRLYHAHLVAEQTIAENIVRFRRDHPAVKLLVFLPNDILIDPREVAAFAEQKMPLRQLILDRAQPLRATRPQLLAQAGRASLQIVDRAPRALPHHRRLRPPRLRA